MSLLSVLRRTVSALLPSTYELNSLMNSILTSLDVPGPTPTMTIDPNSMHLFGQREDAGELSLHSPNFLCFTNISPNVDSNIDGIVS